MTSRWSRRDALTVGAWGLLAGAIALGGRLAGRAFERRPQPARRLVAVGPVAAVVAGSQRTVGEIIVVRDDRGLAAVSSRCTHLGCTVTATARGFDCPCHGSAFARDGRVLRGPATENLPWYRVLLGRDGELRVDLNEQVAATARLEVDEEA